MTSYWIVVSRGNAELFELLSVAFEGRAEFTVIVDRRADDSTAFGTDAAERRGQRADLGPDEIIVAEQSARAERSSSPGQRPQRSVPVIRSRPHRRVRRRAGDPRGHHAAHPSASLTR